jgi:hypothetical protein
LSRGAPRPFSSVSGTANLAPGFGHSLSGSEFGITERTKTICRHMAAPVTLPLPVPLLLSSILSTKGLTARRLSLSRPQPLSSMSLSSPRHPWFCLRLGLIASIFSLRLPPRSSYSVYGRGGARPPVMSLVSDAPAGHQTAENRRRAFMDGDITTPERL